MLRDGCGGFRTGERAPMEDELREFFTRMRAALFAGDLGTLLKRIELPLVIYTPAGVTVLQTTEEVTASITAYRQTLIGMGIVAGECRVIEHSEIANSRFWVTAEFAERDDAGDLLTTSVARYFLVESDDLWKFEMLEYSEIPIPLEDVERIIH